MGVITVKRGKIVSRPSLYDTLRSMALCEPQKFAVRQFKVGAVRTAVTELKKQGFEFKVTEAGLVDEYVVTRLK